MRRLWYFWSGLPLSSKLQFIVLALILSTSFIYTDLNPNKKAFGLKLWKVTVPLICSTILLSRLLLPLMMRNPPRAERLLGGLGLLVFGLWIYSSFQKARLVWVYLTFTTGMWLDASCWFWFISEIRMREAEFLNEKAATTKKHGEDFEDEETDE